MLGVACRLRASCACAAIALRNIVRANPDNDRGWREARVLQLLTEVRAYCDRLRHMREPSS